ncbi:unnamed protein product [Trichobilharzia regenti]|nr:unnamed protein product [Trichobilharzia regenti]
MMTLSEASVNSIASTAMKTIKFLIKCWNLLEDNSTDENDLNSRQFPIKSNSSNDISSIVNLPLKLLTCIEDSGDNNSNNNNNNNSEGGVIAVPAAIDRRDEDATNSVELSISEACRTVTVITDFLVYSIRTSSIVLSNWTMNFYLKLVSLLYEHLRW